MTKEHLRMNDTLVGDKLASCVYPDAQSFRICYCLPMTMNRTFDGTLNSPNERNKTLCFVRLVHFIFKLQNSRSRQTLENSHTTNLKILVHIQKIVTLPSHVFVPY